MVRTEKRELWRNSLTELWRGEFDRIYTENKDRDLRLLKSLLLKCGKRESSNSRRGNYYLWGWIMVLDVFWNSLLEIDSRMGWLIWFLVWIEMLRARYASESYENMFSFFCLVKLFLVACINVHIFMKYVMSVLIWHWVFGDVHIHARCVFLCTMVYYLLWY